MTRASSTPWPGELPSGSAGSGSTSTTSAGSGRNRCNGCTATSRGPCSRPPNWCCPTNTPTTTVRSPPPSIEIRRTSGAFSTRHRIVDTHGDVRYVVVVGDQLIDDSAVIGTHGFYVDVTPTLSQEKQELLNEAVAEIAESRSAIEQVKGMLMVVYRISADTAFELLRWRSQETNVKAPGARRADRRRLPRPRIRRSPAHAAAPTTICCSPRTPASRPESGVARRNVKGPAEAGPLDEIA